MSDLIIIGGLGLLLGLALASLALLQVSPDLEARWPWLEKAAGAIALITGGALVGLGLGRRSSTDPAPRRREHAPEQRSPTLEEETHPDADAIPIYPLPPRQDPDSPAVDDLDAWAADYVAGAGKDGILEAADDEEVP